MWPNMPPEAQDEEARMHVDEFDDAFSEFFFPLEGECCLHWPDPNCSDGELDDFEERRMEDWLHGDS